MLRNYLKTTWRFLLKNKTFSFINIVGLATGTLCCLYILLYVQDQYSYDKHHDNAGNIYRLTTDLDISGDKHHSATSSPPISPAMKSDFPEVEQYTRVVSPDKFGGKEHLLRYKEQSFYESDAVFVDSTFFDVFKYHFVGNTPSKPLTEPYTIVLYKPVAERLFGNASDAVGKVINIDDAFGKHDFKVTGVVDDAAGRSHIHENMYITMNSSGLGQYVRGNNNWAGNNFLYAYVRLRPGINPASLESKLPALLKKNGEQMLKTLGMRKVIHLEPVSSIHTTGGFEGELSKTLSPTFLYILILIAVMIQIIACINFMNLSTARASKRAKEVGVRKVVGAGQTDLMKQFLSESFMLALIGVAIALPLLIMLLPYLNNITQSDIRLSFFGDYKIWLMLLALVAITGFVAGSYPAFYLSAFKVVKVIKGDFTSRVSAGGIRKSLVVFQFWLSIILVSGIIIIYSQLNYIKTRDLGFDKSQKLIFSFYTSGTQRHMQAFSNDLRQMAEVKAVSNADNFLGQFVPHDHGVYLEGSNMANAIDAKNINTDENFVKANGIKLIAGRDFRLHDSTRVLINETMAKRLGIDPMKAVGTRLYTKYDPQPAYSVEIIGVMKDFNFNSLHEQVGPFMLVYDGQQSDLNDIIVSTSSADYHNLLTRIEAIWHKDIPEAPFEFSFLDEEVQKQYSAEITLSQIINSFTLMAILISCLGLFGLAAFSAEQRSKEIGIRKVLGASVFGIVQLLSTDFLRLIAIALVIAVPVSWWSMSQWLQSFNVQYRISISWWMFALAGGLAIAMALVTVSFQAIKAALTNPVKSLRSE